MKFIDKNTGKALTATDWSEIENKHLMRVVGRNSDDVFEVVFDTPEQVEQCANARFQINKLERWFDWYDVQAMQALRAERKGQKDWFAERDGIRYTSLEQLDTEADKKQAEIRKHNEAIKELRNG